MRLESRFHPASAAPAEVRFESVTPVLRIFDAERAKVFWVDYLGFHWDWEQRPFEDGPVYAQISRGPLVLHLSERHEDGSPGVSLVVGVNDVVALHRELEARNYTRATPVLAHSEDEGLTLQLIDPFANRLRFRETRAG